MFRNPRRARTPAGCRRDARTTLRRATILQLNPTFIYVGAIYAIAVALARRGGNPLPRRIAVLFYALVLVFLFKAMTGPYVCIATDVLKLEAPWSASAPGLTKYTVLNMETQDMPMLLVPFAHQVREAWKMGQVPLWNA